MSPCVQQRYEVSGEISSNYILIFSVPQSLLHFGALEYSSSLLETLEKGIKLDFIML